MSSWLSWGSATNPQYEELVEKACSPLNLTYPQSENIADSLEITDMIRSKAVQPKAAMQSLKRRVGSQNGRVQMYAIGLVDTCIKNGGDHFLAEIASKEFVDEMSRIIKSPLTSAEVKQMAVKYFQQWAVAFKPKRELSFFVDVYNELKNSGIDFPPPPAQTSFLLLETTTAPTWIDSDVCMRCRTAFTFTNRKHHCRNCGLCFDQACSSKSLPLPHFGITTPVRVCDSCYVKGGGPVKATGGPAPAVPAGKTLRSKEDFDADLQRAIELSLAESRDSGPSAFMGSEPPLARTKQAVEDDDEELRMAIEASLREMEKARPSAPNGYDEPEYKPLPTFDLAPRETETILTFSNTLDQMAAYGERDLRRFPHAHVLYEQAYAVGGKLHRNVEEKTTKQQMLAEMQDKLSQAVGLYGQILDGQQAYTARKLQEQQQRQYAQQQQYSQYQPYQPPQGYDNRYASPVPNGHGYAAYQPPQPQAPAASSLYPAMPSMQQPQIYPSQQQQQQYGYPAQSQPPYHQAQGSSMGYQPYQHPYPQHQYAPPVASAPVQPPLERHSSIRSVSSASHNPLQRQTSASYPAHPVNSDPQQARRAPAIDTSAPSAPPVDMASHPSASPRSIKSASALPPTTVNGSSYNSPTPVVAQLPSSPQKQWQQQQAAPSHMYPQQQQQQQHMYYDTSFPSAPAAVFPDAPVVEPDVQPQGMEKKEKEEALLIEL